MKRMRVMKGRVMCGDRVWQQVKAGGHVTLQESVGLMDTDALTVREGMTRVVVRV